MLVVLESTTYPGTTEELLRPILEASGLVAGRDFALGYSPERIDPGNRDHRLDTTPKIVAGLTDRCRDLAVSFYSSFVHTVVTTTSSPREAEMAKLIENTYRQVNIALVNELAVLARDLGVDIWEASLAGRLDEAVRLPGLLARARAWADIASRSIPRTCRGVPASSSAIASSSSSMRTRSTTACPTTWWRGSRKH